MFIEWTINKHPAIVTTNNYHINNICLKSNDLKKIFWNIVMAFVDIMNICVLSLDLSKSTKNVILCVN